MGIHELNKILKKEVPEAFRHVPVRAFRGRRIAIDGPLWAYANFSVCYCDALSRIHDFSTLLNWNAEKKENSDFSSQENILSSFLSRVTDFVSQLFTHGITPVFVFDGASLAAKNAHARKRRRLVRESTQRRIMKLKESIESKEPIFRTAQDLISLRKLLCQQVPLTPEIMDSLRTFLSERLGVPVVSAPDEAEKFCSYLAVIGTAAAVWTTDTDTYVFGAPLVVHGMALLKKTLQKEKNNHEEEKKSSLCKEKENNISLHDEEETLELYFPTVVVPLILQKLRLTRPQFVDFCIFLGCDFNERMPHVGIGPQKCWKMVKEHLAESIKKNKEINNTNEKKEEFKENSSPPILLSLEKKHPALPWNCLNTEECRKIFLDFSAAETIFQQMDQLCVQRENLLEQKALACFARCMVPPRNVSFSK